MSKYNFRFNHNIMKILPWKAGEYFSKIAVKSNTKQQITNDNKMQCKCVKQAF